MRIFFQKFGKLPLYGLAIIAVFSVGIVAVSASLYDTQAQAAGRSILDIISGRSPGERGIGALWLKKVKARDLSTRDVTARRTLEGRILAPPADSSVPGGSIASAPDALVWLPGPVSGWEAPAIVQPAIESGLAPLVGSPAFWSVGGVGGGSGNIAGPGGTPLTPAIPTVPPAVTVPHAPAIPEPQTWAMMLLGLFACGAALRRRPRFALPAHAS